MHGKLRQTHIDRMHARLNVRQIAERRATRHVALVGKRLRGNVGIVANCLEHGAAKGIGAVLLVGSFLDNDAAIELHLISRVRLLGVIGVHGMCVVAAHEHRRRERAMVALVIETERGVDAPKGVCQKRRHRALFGVGADLLIIKAAENRNVRSVLGSQKSLQRRIGTGKVIELGSRNELVSPTPDSGVLTVDQKEVATQNLLGIHVKLIGDQRVEIATR